MCTVPHVTDDLEFSGVALGSVVSQPKGLVLLSEQPYFETNYLDVCVNFQHKIPLVFITFLGITQNSE